MFIVKKETLNLEKCNKESQNNLECLCGHPRGNQQTLIIFLSCDSSDRWTCTDTYTVLTVDTQPLYLFLLISSFQGWQTMFHTWFYKNRILLHIICFSISCLYHLRYMLEILQNIFWKLFSIDSTLTSEWFHISEYDCAIIYILLLTNRHVPIPRILVLPTLGQSKTM